MTPVRWVSKMPWCLTARRWQAAAAHRKMECGSAGNRMCRWGRDEGGAVCMHAWHANDCVCSYMQPHDHVCLEGGPRGPVPHSSARVGRLQSHFAVCEIVECVESVLPDSSRWDWCFLDFFGVLSSIRLSFLWHRSQRTLRTFFILYFFCSCSYWLHTSLNVPQEKSARWDDLQKQFQCLEHTEEMHRHGEFNFLSFLNQNQRAPTFTLFTPHRHCEKLQLLCFGFWLLCDILGSNMSYAT